MISLTEMLAAHLGGGPSAPAEPTPPGCRASPIRIEAARRDLEDMGIAIIVSCSTTVEMHRERAP